MKLRQSRRHKNRNKEAIFSLYFINHVLLFCRKKCEYTPWHPVLSIQFIFFPLAIAPNELAVTLFPGHYFAFMISKMALN